mmetsp:Transcript_42241/g.92045  ORF Transcript_42241/g.92045 Transcript_42241/m.92045 type:complete len:371 (-) Transcript_42241:19-1131(-)
MVIDTWIIQAYLLLTSGGSERAMGGATIFRLLRLLRLTRMARAVRALPELQTIVLGMVAGMRSVSIMLLFLVGITYVFAIIFRQVTKDTEIGAEHFPSVSTAFYNLWLEGLMPDNASLMGILSDETWLFGLFFFLFIFLASMTLMNMLIGIICDVVRSVTESQKEQNELVDMTSKISAMLFSMDADYDGFLSRAGFGKFMHHEGTMKFLHDVGVDVHAVLDEVEGMFLNPNDKIGVEDFADVVGQFRKNSAATTRSIAGLRKFVRDQTDQIKESVREIRVIMRDLRAAEEPVRSLQLPLSNSDEMSAFRATSLPSKVGHRELSRKHPARLEKSSDAEKPSDQLSPPLSPLPPVQPFSHDADCVLEGSDYL